MLTPRTASDPTTIARQLLESWKDTDYRHQFVRERVQSSVALQIRSLREQRNGMTQTELARRMRKAQPWISQIENPDYGKWSVATLLDCAEAFDNDLEIKFRPFSRALHELSHQNEEYFRVNSFEEELPELERAATVGWTAPSGKWTDTIRAQALLYPSQGIPNPAINMAVSQPVTVPLRREINSLSLYASYIPTGIVSFSTLGGVPTVDLSEELEKSEGEKDKRRRKAKGLLKRAA